MPTRTLILTGDGGDDGPALRSGASGADAQEHGAALAPDAVLSAGDGEVGPAEGDAAAADARFPVLTYPGGGLAGRRSARRRRPPRRFARNADDGDPAPTAVVAQADGRPPAATRQGGGLVGRRSEKRRRVSRQFECEADDEEPAPLAVAAKRDEQWEARFRELKEFKEELGHCNVPSRRPGGLRRWVENQCSMKKTGRLDVCQIQKLEKLNFPWGTVKTSHPRRWKVRFQQLKEFKEEHGHYNVPSKHPGGLGTWVYNQRRGGKEGSQRLDTGRTQKLEELGFRWGTVKTSHPWEVRFQQLKQFKEEHGHCDVPQKHQVGLGYWVMYQRSRSNRKGSRYYDAGRTQQLEELGFRWGTRQPDKAKMRPWEVRFQELKDFKEEHGHCDIPSKHPGGLGIWVECQRLQKESHRLNTGWIQKLEELGFHWGRETTMPTQTLVLAHDADSDADSDADINEPVIQVGTSGADLEKNNAAIAPDVVRSAGDGDRGRVVLHLTTKIQAQWRRFAARNRHVRRASVAKIQTQENGGGAPNHEKNDGEGKGEEREKASGGIESGGRFKRDTGEGKPTSFEVAVKPDLVASAVDYPYDCDTDDDKSAPPAAKVGRGVERGQGSGPSRRDPSVAAATHALKGGERGGRFEYDTDHGKTAPSAVAAKPDVVASAEDGFYGCETDDELFLGSATSSADVKENSSAMALNVLRSAGDDNVDRAEGRTVPLPARAGHVAAAEGRPAARSRGSALLRLDPVTVAAGTGGHAAALGVSYSDRWEARFQDLKEFQAEHGHCDVPSKHPERLGHWVNHQRSMKKIGRLAAGRAKKLEELGFRWGTPKTAPSWGVRFQQLKEFKEEHGHCNVPKRHPGGLGHWVQYQRRAGSQRRNAGQTQKLEELGFRWNTTKRQMWEVRFWELNKFKEAHGHCNVPKGHPGGLGRWVERQRSKKESQRLDTGHTQKLEWEAWFQELKEFKEEHGHCNVPWRHAGGLGNWVLHQRSKRGSQCRDTGQTQKLEELGFRWW